MFRNMRCNGITELCPSLLVNIQAPQHDSLQCLDPCVRTRAHACRVEGLCSFSTATISAKVTNQMDNPLPTPNLGLEITYSFVCVVVCFSQRYQQ